MFNFAWPQRGYGPVRASLQLQSQRFMDCKDSTQENLGFTGAFQWLWSREAIDTARAFPQKYRITTPPTPMSTMLSDTGILKTAMLINMKGSPGWFWKSYGTANRDVLSKPEVRIELVKYIRRFMQRIGDLIEFYDYKQLRVNKNYFDCAVKQLRQELKNIRREGYAWVFSLMIKLEPHKLSKIEEKRLRIIFAGSLPQLIMQTILMNEPLKALKRHWEDNESIIGMSLAVSGIEAVRDNINGYLLPKAKARKATIKDSDMHGLDWHTTAAQLCVQHCQILEKAYSEEVKDSDQYAVAFKYALAFGVMLSEKIVSLGDGALYEQMQPGVQPSGQLITTDGNSECTLTLARKASAIAAKCVGDDLVGAFTKTSDEVVKLYKKYGHVADLHDVDLDEGFEFCSHRLSKDKCYCLRYGKSLFSLVSRAYREDRYESLVYELGTGIKQNPYWHAVLLIMDTHRRL